MKTKKKSKLFCVAAILLLMTGCKQKEIRKLHEVEAFRPGNFFYLDQVKNRQVMQIKDATEDSLYASYLVGFLDSTYVSTPEKPEHEERIRTYYRFQMGNNWRAIVDGDSLLPVFYQPAPQADNRINAGVIVFQLENGIRPDTLVYKDAAGVWNNLMISLKHKKLIQ